MTRRSVIRGTDHYLPARIVPNSEFEATLDTTDEWIVQRTGIRQRYIAGEGETTASLGEQAARVGLILEAFVPFQRELSVVAVRGRDGEFRAWPLTENWHVDGVLSASLAPALCAISAAPAMSVIVQSGFDGVSTQTSFGPRANTSARASGAIACTRCEGKPPPTFSRRALTPAISQMRAAVVI